MLFDHSPRACTPPAADLLLGGLLSMQIRRETTVGRRWGTKCRFGVPVRPLWVPTVAKQVPKTPKMMSRWPPKAALDANFQKNGETYDLHGIYYTLATSTASENRCFQHFGGPWRVTFQSFSQILSQSPPRRDLGTILVALVTQLGPTWWPAASKMPPKIILKMSLGARWCPRGCPGYPPSSKSHRNTHKRQRLALIPNTLGL